MKRILLPLVLAFVATANTWAEDDYDYAEINGIWYDLNLNKKFAEATGLSEDVTGSIAIPAFVTYNGSTYTVVGLTGFSTKSLTSITIPNTVRYIYEDGIEGNISKNESLTDIIVDEGNPNYSSLNGVLFNKNKSELLYCPAGKSGSYTIPNSVESIGYGAFSGCTSLTSVTIPNSVKSIDDDAFEYCTSLTSVTISNGVTNIGHSAFFGCFGLTSVTIPNSVESIGYGAFRGCM